MSRLMLIGDSIRMSYQSFVAETLTPEGHEVWGPTENCQFSLYTLASLGRWLTDFPDPTVIHWNNGLHDIGHNPFRAPVQMPLDVYAGNLGFIARHLQTTGARIIFALNTPVHADRPFRDDTWSWRNDEIDAYNQAAREVMTEYEIPLNDLHAVVATAPDTLLAEDQLHLSEAGQRACARQVADAIRAQF
jgi:lysophospholipase L1-like esterase